MLGTLLCYPGSVIYRRIGIYSYVEQCLSG
jgi:hypothetical protein